MMEAKENVLDRVEQSFELFTKNFNPLFLPLFIYNFLTVTLFTSIITFGGIYFGKYYLNKLNLPSEASGAFLYSPEIIISVAIGIILLILYFIVYIAFYIGLIKSIHHGYNDLAINWREDLQYGFKSLFRSFTTYWYIFSYVALIPCLTIIIGGSIAIYGLHFEDIQFQKLGAIISVIGGVLLVIFLVYRGIKATFSIYSAVDKDSYTIEDFHSSINITKNNWWRIVGNLLLVGIIGSLAIGVIQGIIDSFGSSLDIGSESLLNMTGELSMVEITEMMSKALNSYSPITNLITNTLQGLLNTIFTIFMAVFTYFFFKRLEKEYKQKDKNINY